MNNNFKVINTNTIIKDLEEENKKLKNKIKTLILLNFITLV